MDRYVTRRGIPLQLFIGVAIGVLIVITKLAADPILGTPVPFLLTTAGTAIAVLVAGPWAGVAAATTMLPAVTYFLMRAEFSSELTVGIQLVLHFATLTIVIVLGGKLHASRSEAYERQESLEVTLSSIGDAVIATDDTGHVTFINAIAEHLTGWTRRDAAGKHLADIFRIVNEDTHQPVHSPVDRVLAEGTIVGLANHTLLIRRDGSEVPIDDSAAPIRNAAGTIVGVILVFRNVAERRKQERALAESQRALEDANRAKDEFLTVLSHELRTPMTSILGWASMLRSSAADPSLVGPGLDAIFSAAKTQTRLIEEILDVSRIITGKLRIERSPQSLRLIVEAAADNIRPAAEEKRHDFAIDWAADDIRVWADPTRLQQVVWNLLSNAVKFTPDGGRIRVSCERRDGHAVLTVSDTGRGISPEFVPRLFSRFAQQDGGPGTPNRGLGIGLSLVQHLVEMHGGQVFAHSDGEGKGATFTIILPALTVAEVPRDGDDESASLFGRALAGVRVLIVDDDSGTLDYLTSVFRTAGAECVPAESAERAMLHLESDSTDLIVSDLMMPGCDGFAFLSRVRKSPIERIRAIPAVALTAAITNDDRNLAFASGFQEFVRKPVEPGTIVSAAAKLIGRG